MSATAGIHSLKSDPFRSFLILSGVSHAIVIGFLTVRMFFFPSETLLLQEAIRVDIVGLPDKAPEMVDKTRPATVAEKTSPVADKAAPSSATLRPPAVQEKTKLDNRKLQQDALRRLKARESIDRLREMEEQAERQRQLEELRRQMAQKRMQEFKGNQIMTGTGLTGLEKLAYDRYYPELKTHILAHWQIPQHLNEAELKVQVAIVVDDTGAIRQKKIVSSSGNEVFDGFAIAALERASPVPPPPRQLLGVMASGRLTLNFP
jgi:TonB family protein